MNFHFSIVKKMVLGITAVSTITYGTSAFFIFVLKDWFRNYVPEWLFIMGTLALGIFWTGFLGWGAAKWFVYPFLQLTHAANMASEGNLQVPVTPSKSNDELRTLGLSFQKMIGNLRQMVTEINASFYVTDSHEDEIRNAQAALACHTDHRNGRRNIPRCGAPITIFGSHVRLC